jgi:hypothetical protein
MQPTTESETEKEIAMTTKKSNNEAETVDAAVGANGPSLADQLSSLMVSVRTSQATGQFTPEQEAEWMAIDGELRGPSTDAEAVE